MPTLTQRLADLAGDRIFTSARVLEVGRLSPRFVTVTLQHDSFRESTWIPGSKLQFRPRRGTFSTRTYTPSAWDTAAGTTQLIAFVHTATAVSTAGDEDGTGPASGWFSTVAAGDECELMGPRRSLDLKAPAGRVVFVGDESSLALAVALRTVTGNVRHVFEADDPAELTAVLTELGLADSASVVLTSDDRTPLLDLADEAAQLDGDPFDLVVTGDAATVLALRRGSRQWARKPASVKGKAYWAAGRTGLD